MAVRRDDVQLHIDFITDESQALARTLQTTKAYNAELAQSAAKMKLYQKELAAVGADEAKRAPVLAKITLEEQKVAAALNKIALEGKKVEGLDLNRVVPAQLIERAKQLEQAMKLIPTSSPAYRQLQAELQGVNSRLATLRAETKGVVEGMKDAGTGTGFFQRALAGTVGTLVGLNLDSLLDRLRDWGTELFNLGVGLDAAREKTATVFGDAEVIVQGFAEANARSLGLARQEYENLATAAGDLLKPMGFAEAEVANLSAALTDQAGIQSEWTQGKVSTVEASSILTKALLGERDALNSLGIDIKDAIIQDELTRKGLSDLTGASRRQAEALITLEQITLQSASANEAFAKNTDSLVRKKAELRARLAEVSQTAANLLVPVFSFLLSLGLKLIEWAVTFAQTLAAIPGFVRENQVAIGLLVVSLLTLNAQGILAAANMLRMAAATGAATIATNAQAVAQRALNFVLSANPIGLVISLVAALAAVFVTAYEKSETFRRIVVGTFQAITSQIVNVLGFLNDLGQGLGNLFTGNFSAAVDNFSSAFGRLDPREIGRQLSQSFTAGYNSVPAPKPEIKADLPAAQAVGNQVGAAMAGGFEQQFDNLRKTGEKGADALAKAAKERLDLRLKDIEAAFLKEELVQDRALFQGEINEGLHAKRVLELRRKQYQDQIAAFQQFHLAESKEALEAQKKLLEIEQQLTRKPVAPLAALPTAQPGQVTSQTAAGLAGADVSASDEVRVLREKFAAIVTLEQANELTRIDLQRNALEARLQFLRNAGLEETAVYQETLDAKEEADKNFFEAQAENERRSAELKKQVQESTYQVTSDFIGLAIDLLSEDEKARKKNAGAIKAFQIAQVTIQGISEVQKIWAHAADLGPIAGPIIGAFQTALAVGRTVFAISKIQAAKFERGRLLQVNAGGGMSDLGGSAASDVDQVSPGSSADPAMQLFFHRLLEGEPAPAGMPRGKFGYFGGRPHSAGGTKGYFDDGTAIEVERDEAFAVVNKKNAPMLRFLSKVNAHQGNGVPFFQKGGMLRYEGGGLTQVNTNPVPASASVPEAAVAAQSGMDMAEEIRGLRSDIGAWRSTLTAVIVYQDLEDSAAEVAAIRDDASI